MVLLGSGPCCTVRLDGKGLLVVVVVVVVVDAPVLPKVRLDGGKGRNSDAEAGCCGSSAEADLVGKACLPLRLEDDELERNSEDEAGCCCCGGSKA